MSTLLASPRLAFLKKDSYMTRLTWLMRGWMSDLAKTPQREAIG